ncbi:MAG: WD40 repeat domain-containing protein, partial [Verrucomicrobia bacterium]|nr:WD40 repeat domain-containing protein [Verrucomicrobiota bacterium]
QHLAVSAFADPQATNSCIKIVDATTGKTLLILKLGDESTGNTPPTQAGRETRITGLTYSPDGRQIAALQGEPPELRVWEAATGRELSSTSLKRISPDGRIPYGHFSLVIYSPDGRHLATWGDPVCVWDASTGKLLFEAEGSRGIPRAFSRDGRRLYVKTVTGELQAWDLTVGKATTASDDVGACADFAATRSADDGGWAISSDGTRVAFGSVQTCVMDPQTRKPICTLKEPGNLKVFSPDGRRLATIRSEFEGTRSAAGKLRTGMCTIWDVDTGERLNVVLGAGANLEYHPDGRRIATAFPSYEPREGNEQSADCVVRILDTESEPAVFEFPPEYSGPIAFSPDGRYLVLAKNTNGSVVATIYELATKRNIISIGPIMRAGSQEVRTFADTQRYITNQSNLKTNLAGEQIREPSFQYLGDIVFSPDGRRLVTLTGSLALLDCEVKFWNAETGRELMTIRRPAENHLRQCAFSPDGRLFALSGDWGCEICDATVGRTAFKISGKGVGFAFSPDSRFLATDTGTWEAGTGRLIREFRNVAAPNPSLVGRNNCLIFDPQARRLAVGSGGDDGMIRLLDATSGKQLLLLRGHAGPVVSLCFTPDGERLFSASLDGSVRIWEGRTGRTILTLPLPLPPDPVFFRPGWPRVAISPDGTHLAASGDRVRIWRAAPAVATLK